MLTMSTSRRLLIAKQLMGGIGVAVALSILSCQRPAPAPKPQLPPQGGEVHGFVATAANDRTKLPAIRLPNIRVFLKNLTQNTVTPPVTTNTHGYFAIPRQPPGRYELCMEGPGFIAGCDPAPIAIAGETIVLNHDALIAPEAGVVRGTVLFSGKPARKCYEESSQFNTLVAAKVSLTNPGGAVVLGPVTGNSEGQYVLPKVPAAGSYRIVATCDGASTVMRSRIQWATPSS